MKKIVWQLLLIGLIWHAFGTAHAQNTIYTRYIEEYKDLAIEQMNKHNIPASITLAQGLLESAAGTSVLAQKANNHFGIKCHSDWDGKYIRQDDDSKGERFRVYRSVKDSYEDHSLFLKRSRYASLFELEVTDYKAWAHGLKRCGYATNPKYAHLLINLIERFDLHQYDYLGKNKGYSPLMAGGRQLQVLLCNKNYYVLAAKGDTWKSIAKAVGVSERKLRKYNEVDKHYILEDGDIIYLEKKQKKAAKELKGTIHVVKAGESLHHIAQMYGMRMKTLYKLNHLDQCYSAKEGDVLQIR